MNNNLLKKKKSSRTQKAQKRSNHPIAVENPKG